MNTVGRQTLEAGLEEILASPRERGVLRLIVRRPRRDERELLETGELDLVQGLVGDDWLARGSRATADGAAHPGMQLNVTNARSIALIAGVEERWALAGDQLYVDFDLSSANTPPGTRLAVGTAVIEITEVPHTGCKKFIERYGVEAGRFVNSRRGRELNLRGVCARVVEPGTVRVGDAVIKLSHPPDAR